MKRNWLVDARKKTNLSQEEISKLLNIAQPTYASYEIGIRTPKPKIAIKIGKILNINWQQFYIEEKGK